MRHGGDQPPRRSEEMKNIMRAAADALHDILRHHSGAPCVLRVELVCHAASAASQRRSPPEKAFRSATNGVRLRGQVRHALVRCELQVLATERVPPPAVATTHDACSGLDHTAGSPESAYVTHPCPAAATPGPLPEKTTLLALHTGHRLSVVARRDVRRISSRVREQLVVPLRVRVAHAREDRLRIAAASTKFMPARRGRHSDDPGTNASAR